MTSTANRGYFDRSCLPDPLAYAKSQDIALRGRSRWRSGACPLCTETLRDPFHLEVKSGGFRCHACQETGGDVLVLHRLLHGLGFIEAARELGVWVEDNEDAPAAAQRAPLATHRDKATERAEQAEREAKQARAAVVWSATELLAPGTPAAAYLEGRGCPLPPTDGDLHWIARLRLYGFDGPAMVGRISDATDTRRLLGLHLTWLRQDGSGWARGERRYLGTKQGGVVRLWPDEAVTQGLGVAEGLESSLTLAHLHAPVWATLDAGNLARFAVLEGVESLVIAADHDEAGMRAASSCAERWADEGREVTVLRARAAGADINDLMRAAA